MAKNPKLRLEAHLPSAELQQRYRAARDASQARRLPVAWLSLGQEDNELERFLRTNVDELSLVDLEEKAYRSNQTQSSRSLRQ